VQLNVDLTRYHQHLTPGTDCCGHVMDTLLTSLTVTEEPSS
jgi:hypothetical protein